MFWWFGFTILLTGAAVFGVLALAPRSSPWRDDVARIERYVANRAADVWDRPDARAAFIRGLAADLELGVAARAADGRELDRAGPPCARADWRVAVRDGDRELGAVIACRAHSRGDQPWLLALVLITIGACLWMASGWLARRLLRPLREIVRVAHEIGAGRLEARARSRGRPTFEMEVLGNAINDMAARIQKQIAEQRALLAAVSHEIRTPLGHMRVLVELCRDEAGGGDAHGALPEHLDALEREILHADALVGKLLASSRLEFDAVERRPIDARDAALRALERAGLPAALLRVDATAELEADRAASADGPDDGGDGDGDGGRREAADTRFHGDPTLIARALANLLENARVHGGGATALIVSVDPIGADQAEHDSARRRGDVAFEVCDDGPGVPADERERVFEMFHRAESTPERPAARSDDGPSLGLGLALVRRIAEAHGGTAWATEAPGGGARVGFSVARPYPIGAPIDDPIDAATEAPAAPDDDAPGDEGDPAAPDSDRGESTGSAS